MTHLFSDLNFVKVYLDDILIVSCTNETDHLNKLLIVLNRLRDHNLKVKVKSVNFYKSKLVT